jgi:hypothetical protein
MNTPQSAAPVGTNKNPIPAVELLDCSIFQLKMPPQISIETIPTPRPRLIFLNHKTTTEIKTNTGNTKTEIQIISLNLSFTQYTLSKESYGILRL